VPEAGRQGVFDEFSVDLERDASIVRWEAFARGQAYARCDVIYHPVEQHWLPLSWQSDLFVLTKEGRRQYIRGERMKVTDIQINPRLSAQVFSAPLKHGMVVVDAHTAELFVGGSDGRTLVPYGQSTDVWRWWHWLGITLLFGGVVGGLGYWRYRRRRQFSS
jgi:hypothetical protein